MPDRPGPVPVVVMAHGIGGIKAGGLEPFAQRFASSGFAAVALDYRHWGDSTGEPRQFLSVRRQLQDYRSALAWARTQEEFDAARMFVWGTSFAGMHIVALAASEPGLAGAIAQCPLVDGLAGLTNVPAARALRVAADALARPAGPGRVTARPTPAVSAHQRAPGAARGDRNRRCDGRHGPTRSRRRVLV